MINIYTYLLLSEYNDEFVQTHSWVHVATFIISYCVQSTILLDSGYNMLNRYIPVVVFVVFLVSKSSLFGTQGPQHTRLSCASLSPSLLRLMFIESVMLFNHLFSYHPLLLPSIFPSIRVFPNESTQLFALGGQSTGASASASVLPMNIQGWFPLGVTGLISLQSKGFSRILASTALGKHQFFGN